MKQSKGFVHKKGKLMDNWHPTEVYDHVVPSKYKTKEYSRQGKFIRQLPNHLMDSLIEDEVNG